MAEPEGDGARIYFGEFDENLREASPGLLDRLKPEAKVAGSDKALKVDKTAGVLRRRRAVGKDDSIVAENVAVNERRGDKPTKVLTRWGARTVADFKELPPSTRSTSCRPASLACSRSSTRASRSPRPRPS